MLGVSELIAIGTFAVSTVAGGVGTFLKLRGQINDMGQTVDLLTRDLTRHLADTKPLMHDFIELRTRYDDLVKKDEETADRAESQRQEILAALRELNAKIDHLTRRVYSRTTDSA